MTALPSLTLFALWGGFGLALLSETIWPRYDWGWRARAAHFARNLGLGLIVVVVTSWFFRHVFQPVFLLSTQWQLGLLPRLGAPLGVTVVVGILAADFAGYAVHRANHRFHWLWLLHAVHHSDTRLDASTSLRQHPLAYVLTLSVRALLIIALGAPPWVLAVRGFAAIATSHLHHAAIAWSPRVSADIQRYLGWLFVTPMQHWMHHDPDEHNTNANFGQVLSCWDRLFGTYRAPVLLSSEPGLDALREPRWQSVWGMLATPWRARRMPRL